MIDADARACPPTSPAPLGGGTPRKKKTISASKAAAFQAKQENTGVLLVGRVPPYLKPSALRAMLSGYGTEVLRIYLKPEDTAVRGRRVRSGGNKKKCFSEGWVEFSDKRKAKRICSTLNNTPMGGGHRSFYTHDLWNLKYLHKFKWAHLTEKISENNRERQDKMRVELSQASKDTKFYLKKVDQAKAIDAMAERKQKKRKSDGGGADDTRPGEKVAVGTKRRRTGESDGPVKMAAFAAAPAPQVGGEAPLDGMLQVRRQFKQRKFKPRDQTGQSGVASISSLILPTNQAGKQL